MGRGDRPSLETSAITNSCLQHKVGTAFKSRSVFLSGTPSSTPPPLLAPFCHVNSTRQILFPPQRNWFYTWLLQDQVRFSFYLFLRGLEDTNLWWGWGLLYKPVYPRACLQCLVYKRQASCLTLHQLTELMTYLGKLCCFKWYFQGDRAIWDHNFS